nr:protein stabilized1 [Quercus suber]
MVEVGFLDIETALLVVKQDEDGDEADEKGYDENQKFDEFEGNDVGLFANGEYDEDDKEADAVWEAIDKRMDLRQKDRREARLKQEIEKYRASNPKITEQFADLKRKLYSKLRNLKFGERERE